MDFERLPSPRERPDAEHRGDYHSVSAVPESPADAGFRGFNMYHSLRHLVCAYLLMEEQERDENVDETLNSTDKSGSKSAGKSSRLGTALASTGLVYTGLLRWSPFW